MPVNMDKLVAEITSQLEDDILSYGWMLQIAQLQNPESDDREFATAVVDSVIKLHNDGLIVVGETQLSNEMVLINPWQEENNALRARMISEITKYNGSVDQTFCFWIQLSEQFSR